MNIFWVSLGVVFMSGSAAVVGNFTYLRKRALIGDAISHAILPGVCLAFLLFQSKAPLVLLGGAVLSGLIALFVIEKLVDKTRLKADAAMALVLSSFYGLGILLLTAIQQSGNAAQAGLDQFLFGKAAAMNAVDVQTFGLFSILLLLIVASLFYAFRMLVFDRDYAAARGINVKVLEGTLSLLTVVAIALGIQAVGVVLMAALLIAPAAAARFWTYDLKWMIVLSAVLAIFSGLVGVWISYLLPRMPTGPWIVSVLSVLSIGSVLLGTRKGMIARTIRLKRHRRKMLHENILKCFYQLGEKKKDFKQRWDLQQLSERRYIPLPKLKRGIRYLLRKNLIISDQGRYFLAKTGFEEGRRIVRIHRLWELYLTTYMQLPADHVHEDAEAIEHIITPELERELAHRLKHPDIDPHASPIPYE